MMNIQSAYSLWAADYDRSANKTRDLEAVAIRELLQDRQFTSCLEIGCGTGKNTEWLAEKAGFVQAVDLSEAMLAKARAKVRQTNVQFQQADIM